MSTVIYELEPVGRFRVNNNRVFVFQSDSIFNCIKDNVEVIVKTYFRWFRNCKSAVCRNNCDDQDDDKLPHIENSTFQKSMVYLDCSPCNRYLAIGVYGVVLIYDVYADKYDRPMKHTFEREEIQLDLPKQLCWSNDSSIVALFSKANLKIIILSTGVSPPIYNKEDNLSETMCVLSMELFVEEFQTQIKLISFHFIDRYAFALFENGVAYLFKVECFKRYAEDGKLDHISFSKQLICECGVQFNADVVHNYHNNKFYLFNYSKSYSMSCCSSNNCFRCCYNMKCSEIVITEDNSLGPTVELIACGQQSTTHNTYQGMKLYTKTFKEFLTGSNNNNRQKHIHTIKYHPFNAEKCIILYTNNTLQCIDIITLTVEYTLDLNDRNYQSSNTKKIRFISVTWSDHGSLVLCDMDGGVHLLRLANRFLTKIATTFVHLADFATTSLFQDRFFYLTVDENLRRESTSNNGNNSPSSLCRLYVMRPQTIQEYYHQKILNQEFEQAESLATEHALDKSFIYKEKWLISEKNIDDINALFEKLWTNDNIDWVMNQCVDFSSNKGENYCRIYDLALKCCCDYSPSSPKLVYFYRLMIIYRYRLEFYLACVRLKNLPFSSRYFDRFKSIDIFEYVCNLCESGRDIEVVKLFFNYFYFDIQQYHLICMAMFPPCLDVSLYEDLLLPCDCGKFTVNTREFCESVPSNSYLNPSTILFDHTNKSSQPMPYPSHLSQFKLEKFDQFLDTVTIETVVVDWYKWMIKYIDTSTGLFANDYRLCCYGFHQKNLSKLEKIHNDLSVLNVIVHKYKCVRMNLDQLYRIKLSDLLRQIVQIEEFGYFFRDYLVNFIRDNYVFSKEDTLKNIKKYQSVFLKSVVELSEYNLEFLSTFVDKTEHLISEVHSVFNSRFVTVLIAVVLRNTQCFYHAVPKNIVDHMKKISSNKNQPAQVNTSETDSNSKYLSGVADFEFFLKFCQLISFYFFDIPSNIILHHKDNPTIKLYKTIIYEFVRVSQNFDVEFKTKFWVVFIQFLTNDFVDTMEDVSNVELIQKFKSATFQTCMSVLLDNNEDINQMWPFLEKFCQLQPHYSPSDNLPNLLEYCLVRGLIGEHVQKLLTLSNDTVSYSLIYPQLFKFIEYSNENHYFEDVELFSKLKLAIQACNLVKKIDPSYLITPAELVFLDNLEEWARNFLCQHPHSDRDSLDQIMDLFLMLLPNSNPNDVRINVYETLVAHFYRSNNYIEADYFCQLAINQGSVSIWKYCKLLSSNATEISTENKSFLLNYALKVCPKEEILPILDSLDSFESSTENLSFNAPPHHDPLHFYNLTKISNLASFEKFTPDNLDAFEEWFKKYFPITAKYANQPCILSFLLLAIDYNLIEKEEILRVCLNQTINLFCAVMIYVSFKLTPSICCSFEVVKTSPFELLLSNVSKINQLNVENHQRFMKLVSSTCFYTFYECYQLKLISLHTGLMIDTENFILNTIYQQNILKQLVKNNYHIFLEISSFHQYLSSLFKHFSTSAELDKFTISCLSNNNDMLIERCVGIVKNSVLTIDEMNDQFLALKPQYKLPLDNENVQSFLDIWTELDANHLLLLFQWMQQLFSNNTLLINNGSISDHIKWLKRLKSSCPGIKYHELCLLENPLQGSLRYQLNNENLFILCRILTTQFPFLLKPLNKCMIICAYVRACIENKVVEYEKEAYHSDADFINGSYVLVDDKLKLLLKQYSDQQHTCDLVQELITDTDRFSIAVRVLLLKTFNTLINEYYHIEQKFMFELELLLKLFQLYNYDESNVHYRECIRNLDTNLHQKQHSINQLCEMMLMDEFNGDNGFMFINCIQILASKFSLSVPTIMELVLEGCHNFILSNPQMENEHFHDKLENILHQNTFVALCTATANNSESFEDAGDFVVNLSNLLTRNHRYFHHYDDLAVYFAIRQVLVHFPDFGHRNYAMAIERKSDLMETIFLELLDCSQNLIQKTTFCQLFIKLVPHLSLCLSNRFEAKLMELFLDLSLIHNDISTVYTCLISMESNNVILTDMNFKKIYCKLWQNNQYADAILWALVRYDNPSIVEMLWIDIKSSVGNHKFNSAIQQNHPFKKQLIILNLIPYCYKYNKMLYGFLINYCLENQEFLSCAVDQLNQAGLIDEANRLIAECSSSANVGFINKQLHGLYSFFKK